MKEAAAAKNQAAAKAAAAPLFLFYRFLKLQRRGAPSVFMQRPLYIRSRARFLKFGIL